jgi:NADH:ubiquinone oxidoreductase subunit 4 (subunit M)
MTLDTWLRIGAIGMPLLGALVIWRLGTRSPRAQRRLVLFIFGTTGLIALSLFLLNRYYACMLAFGKQNCLFDGAATLSLLLLSIVLARGCIVPRGENRGPDHTSMLLLSSGWAGMGLSKNLFLFLVFMNLFLVSLARWLRRKGIGWRFLILRDDYRDDGE